MCYMIIVYMPNYAFDPPLRVQWPALAAKSSSLRLGQRQSWESASSNATCVRQAVWAKRDPPKRRRAVDTIAPK